MNRLTTLSAIGFLATIGALGGCAADGSGRSTTRDAEPNAAHDGTPPAAPTPGTLLDLEPIDGTAAGGDPSRDGSEIAATESPTSAACPRRAARQPRPAGCSSFPRRSPAKP